MFKVGQKVVAVNSIWIDNKGSILAIVEGEVYTVSTSEVVLDTNVVTVDGNNKLYPASDFRLFGPWDIIEKRVRGV